MVKEPNVTTPSMFKVLQQSNFTEKDFFDCPTALEDG